MSALSLVRVRSAALPLVGNLAFPISAHEVESLPAMALSSSLAMARFSFGSPRRAHVGRERVPLHKSRCGALNGLIRLVSESRWRRNACVSALVDGLRGLTPDRKSTRLNSSHRC